MRGPVKALVWGSAATMAWLLLVLAIAQLAGFDLLVLVLCLIVLAIIVGALVVTQEFARLRAALTKPTPKVATLKRRLKKAEVEAELARTVARATPRQAGKAGARG